MMSGTGKAGEAFAEKYLKRKGYKIIARNFRTRFGEIDLIAATKQYLVFAEVKTRKNDAFARACEAVTPAKQRRLIAAAQGFLAQNEMAELQPRFDVIEVYMTQDMKKPDRIHHLEHAFDA